MHMCRRGFLLAQVGASTRSATRMVDHSCRNAPFKLLMHRCTQVRIPVIQLCRIAPPATVRVLSVGKYHGFPSRKPFIRMRFQVLACPANKPLWVRLDPRMICVARAIPATFIQSQGALGYDDSAEEHTSSQVVRNEVNDDVDFVPMSPVSQQLQRL